MPRESSETVTAQAADSSPASFSAARQSLWSSDFAILTYLALATVTVHLITGGRFGFHRDELATLEDSRHLAWGFVAYPPVTPFFGRLSLILFGTSLTGFRFFAAVAEAIAVILTGLMARELGGRRGAQLVAAAAAIPFLSWWRRAHAIRLVRLSLLGPDRLFCPPPAE